MTDEAMDPSENEATSPLRRVELEDALARRTPRRLRAALITATVLLLALALLPVWHSLAALRQAPTSRASLGVPVEVTSNVTTGAVTLNGRLVGIHLPILVYLRPGVNTIRLDAPPFHRQTCRITTPAGVASDTCRSLGWLPPLSSEQRLYSTADQQIVSAYVVAFLLGLTDLPTSQQTRVLAAIATALPQQLAATTATVPQGDHYTTALAPDGSPLVTRATETLTAAPIAEISRLAGAYSCAVEVCPYLDDSTLSDRASDTTDPNWTVLLGATLGWRFTDPSGAQVGQVLFRAGLVGPTLSVTLAYHAGAGWYAPRSAALADRLRAEVALGLCIDGAGVFSSLESSAQPRVMLIGEDSGETLEGCALSVQVLSGGSQQANLRVLGRFGALLAADPATRALLPDLPLASPQEVAAAGA
jgi:hypothetical protein